MEHLRHLRRQAENLSREYDSAVLAGHDDYAGTIAFRQMRLDDDIARLERRMNRVKEREWKRAA